MTLLSEIMFSVVGIANALDLTDRILPRLQARPNCKPQLLHFAPYTKDQIVAILEDRLSMVFKACKIEMYFSFS